MNRPYDPTRVPSSSFSALDTGLTVTLSSQHKFVAYGAQIACIPDRARLSRGGFRAWAQTLQVTRPEASKRARVSTATRENAKSRVGVQRHLGRARSRQLHLRARAPPGPIRCPFPGGRRARREDLPGWRPDLVFAVRSEATPGFESLEATLGEPRSVSPLTRDRPSARGRSRSVSRRHPLDLLRRAPKRCGWCAARRGR